MLNADSKYPPDDEEPIDSDDEQDQRRVSVISESDEIVPWDCDFWIAW